MNCTKTLAAILLVTISFVGHSVFAMVTPSLQQKVCVQMLKS